MSVESFKEFLKKHKKKVGGMADVWFQHNEGLQDAVLVKDLGNWAFSNWLNSLKEALKECEISDISFYFKEYSKFPELCFDELKEVLEYAFDCEVDVRTWLNYEIAVACLGKKEVEKKLKELKAGDSK